MKAQESNFFGPFFVCLVVSYGLLRLDVHKDVEYMRLVLIPVILEIV